MRAASSCRSSGSVDAGEEARDVFESPFRTLAEPFGEPFPLPVGGLDDPAPRRDDVGNTRLQLGLELRVRERDSGRRGDRPEQLRIAERRRSVDEHGDRLALRSDRRHRTIPAGIGGDHRAPRVVDVAPTFREPVAESQRGVSESLSQFVAQRPRFVGIAQVDDEADERRLRPAASYEVCREPGADDGDRCLIGPEQPVAVAAAGELGDRGDDKDQREGERRPERGCRCPVQRASGVQVPAEREGQEQGGEGDRGPGVLGNRVGGRVEVGGGDRAARAARASAARRVGEDHLCERAPVQVEAPNLRSCRRTKRSRHRP